MSRDRLALLRRRAVRHQVGDRLAVAGDHEALSRLDPAHDLGVVVAQLALGDRPRHATICSALALRLADRAHTSHPLRSTRPAGPLARSPARTGSTIDTPPYTCTRPSARTIRVGPGTGTQPAGRVEPGDVLAAGQEAERAAPGRPCVARQRPSSRAPRPLPCRVRVDGDQARRPPRPPTRPSTCRNRRRTRHVRHRHARRRARRPAAPGARSTSCGPAERRERPREAAGEQRAEGGVVVVGDVVLPGRRPRARPGDVSRGVHRGGCTARSSPSASPAPPSGARSRGRTGAAPACAAARTARGRRARRATRTGRRRSHPRSYSVAFSALIGICSSPSRSMSASAGPPQRRQVVADDHRVDPAEQPLPGAQVAEGDLPAAGEPQDRARQRQPERGDGAQRVRPRAAAPGRRTACPGAG